MKPEISGASLMMKHGKTIREAVDEQLDRFPPSVSAVYKNAPDLLAERDQLKAENEQLRAAAQDVVDRWDTPFWKDVPATANFINRLRAALEKARG